MRSNNSLMLFFARCCNHSRLDLVTIMSDTFLVSVAKRNLNDSSPIVKSNTLAFSFSGLVFASLIYSLPFMVQPLTAAFTELGRSPMEAAASLGARPLDAWLTTILPMARNGYLTAAVLTFAHTVGEFGIVLMVGGNLAGETRVISIAIYESVETLNYQEAYILSGGLMAFSFVVLLGVYQFNRQFAMSLTPRSMR